MKSTKAIALLLVLVLLQSSSFGDTASLTPSKDNTMFQDSNSLSNGKGPFLFTGLINNNFIRRGLVAFDLSSIPANATVTAASLSMYLTKMGPVSPGNISIKKVSRDWGEGNSNSGTPGGHGASAQTNDATWANTFFNTAFWTTPGGDFSPTPSATTFVNAESVTYVWTGNGVIADVQSWVSNGSSNFGWVIIGNEVDLGSAGKFNTRENAANKPRLDITYQIGAPTPTPTPTPSPSPTPSPFATPTPTPTPAPTPTPSPIPFVTIAGATSYCSNPVPGPVADVVLTLTGTASSSVLSDASGNYLLSSLPAGGNYVITPTKVPRSPGSTGIDTVDVIATQRHFLSLGPPLMGCRLTAADVNGDSLVNTVDVVAIQRFFLFEATGIANVGKYLFVPLNRTYMGLNSDQTSQNFDVLILGDTASSFVHRPDETGPPDEAAPDEQ